MIKLLKELMILHKLKKEKLSIPRRSHNKLNGCCLAYFFTNYYYNI
ncbi:hypothetical protein TREPR_2748 [Treponema primitia ZAS-2]|uniref:Uncharacterized protein n=1 Tax=Treponema primitia (strain ATCC BAA-887 / DSM 12427 / ZAS-2) TaxID=545694 RepID=F5YQI8_TREPZ|nr:hypothetical protein TREPR_2748 [Treponema primitia ZAS-2]